MVLNDKYYKILEEDAINRFNLYLLIDEIILEYENIELELLKPETSYISINYKEVDKEVSIYGFSVTIDLYYRNLTTPCGYYKSFYNFDECKSEFECIDEIFELFKDSFQFL